MIQAISHLTFIVRDLDRAGRFFSHLFGAREIYSSGDETFSIAREKFFLIGDIWIALMEGEPVAKSYNHVAFQIRPQDYAMYRRRIEQLELEILPERPRQPYEGQSIYFYDYDNHLFELHTGSLTERLVGYAGQISD